MTEHKNLKPQAEMNSFPVIAAEIPAQAEENCAFQMDSFAPIVSTIFWINEPKDIRTFLIIIQVSHHDMVLKSM